ncbi:MAG: Ig-like domain repeat protein [Frankiaceae bacterium]|nr:Ig-like domain repeat protein [Frankiaceae bacterium]
MTEGKFMKLNLKAVVAGATVLATTGGLVVAAAAPALAAAPPYEPDPNALGRVVFYDAQGHVLTGGNNLKHLADYVAGTTAPTSGSTKATFYFAAPDHNQPDETQWATFDQSASTTFPNAAAPSPISGTAATNANGTSFTGPVVTLGAGDADFTDTVGGVASDSTAGYANIYQVRVYDAHSGSKYWESDIQVNTGAGTWSVADPSIVTESVTLAGTPAGGSSAPGTRLDSGSAITLKATVATPANGTVKFFDNGTGVGTAQAVTTSNGVAQIIVNPADGNHDFTAVFTPNGGTEVTQASSNDTFYRLANLINTTTSLSVNPASSPQFTSATFTANVSEADAPTTTGLAGSVTFVATPTPSGSPITLGTQNTNDGTAGEYKLTLGSVSQPVGNYNVTATFTPTNSNYSNSTSNPPTAWAVTAASCPGAPAGQDPSSPYFGSSNAPTCQDTQNLEVTVNPGSLTISTPYTSTNHFVLPVMKLNPQGTLLSTNATFPGKDSTGAQQYITVVSTLATDPNWTVTCTDTDLVGRHHDSAHLDTINGDNVGLTNGQLVNNGSTGSPTPSFPGGVSFFPITAANGTTTNTGSGMKDNPQTFAKSGSTGTGVPDGGNGTALLLGTLTINAPTQTEADTYDGTITFTVG